MPSASHVQARFAERLRIIRKAKGYQTAREAAEHMGVAENTYTTWERGEKRPGWWHLVLIRRFFGASLDYLLDGDESGISVGLLREVHKVTDAASLPEKT